MTDASTPQNPTVKITLEQTEDYAFRVHFDDSEAADLLTDEPPPLGRGQGPNPSRLLLAAVSNCLTASLLFALRKFDNAPGKLVTTATAELIRNERGRVRVGKVQVRIALAEGGDTHARLERVLAQFEDFCVVTQSVRDGLDVHVSVEDAQGRVLHATPVSV